MLALAIATVDGLASTFLGAGISQYKEGNKYLDLSHSDTSTDGYFEIIMGNHPQALMSLCQLALRSMDSFQKKVIIEWCKIEVSSVLEKKQLYEISGGYYSWLLIEDDLTGIDFRKIQEVYNVLDYDKVMLFMEYHPEVLDLLLDVRELIDLRFPGSNKFLNLFRPPDKEYGPEYLVIYISYDMPLEKAEILLDQLEDDCEFRYSPEFDKLISIDLAF